MYPDGLRLARSKGSWRISSAKGGTDGNACGTKALRQLRRRKRKVERPEQCIYGFGDTSLEDEIYALASLKYSIRRTGDVTYHTKQGGKIVDCGRFITIYPPNDRQAIALALQLAQQKFGNRLTVYGSKQFQLLAAEIAKEKGIKIEGEYVPKMQKNKK